MRFRDLFIVGCSILAATLAATHGKSRLHDAWFAADEVNREDATRESTTVLSAAEWNEFQVVPGASSFRLLTNAALQSIDAPDYDLSNPRLGWRYGIEYELLDASRNLIQKSEYHFRSSIRQLLDGESGEAIYPLFFGKSSLVSTQTRTMQIAVNRENGQQVSILRARLLFADTQIQEVVARALARIERADYEQNSTWNRMSKKRRESISRYCVYDHELLTVNERNSLLRWRWTRCPTLGKFEKRYLFFIGDTDDMEIRDEQLPIGFYTDPQTLATLPIPEGEGEVRLEFTCVESQHVADVVSIDWHGLGSENRKSWTHAISRTVSNFRTSVQGGLLELQTSSRLVVRAFWKPLDELAQRSANELAADSWAIEGALEDEIEITPQPLNVRAFVADEDPIDYLVSHHDEQPTPLKIQVRYPLSFLFENRAAFSENTIRSPTTIENRGTETALVSPVSFRWKFHDSSGAIVESGTRNFAPEISSYDWMTANGMRALVSNASEFYFLVPRNVAKVSFSSLDSRLLVNAFVRPKSAQRKIRVPEDFHPFHRTQATNRSWFSFYPVDHSTLIRSNRSFVIATQVRPPKLNEQIIQGDFDWIRYTPTGSWIGRQILIPKMVETELGVRDEAIQATYYELATDVDYSFSKFVSRFEKDLYSPKLVFSADQPPGQTTISIDGKIIKSVRLATCRGQVDLGDFTIPPQGKLRVESQGESRFFLNGLQVELADCFLKRTAQRLNRGMLEFPYSKSTPGDELLTIRLYRNSTENIRSKVKVRIISVNSSLLPAEQPLSSWTILDRLYDLRPLEESPSLLLGHAGKVDVGHRCFIKLGADLPRGEYRIQVESIDANNDALILLYQTVAGKKPIRKLKIQSINETLP